MHSHSVHGSLYAPAPPKAKVTARKSCARPTAHGSSPWSASSASRTRRERVLPRQLANKVFDTLEMAKAIHYTNVAQPPLIDAINQLPVPKTWRSLEGWQDPLRWSGKLVKLVKTGKRQE